MKSGIHIFLGIYAVLDIVLSLLSSVGWVYYWRLSKYALFIQRYAQLRGTPSILEDMSVNLNDQQLAVKLERKQTYVEGSCGREFYDGEDQYRAQHEFDDVLTSVLAPSVALCCLAMFGFIVGGILIGIMINVSHSKSSVMALGFSVVVVELLSILVLLGGALIVVHKRLCAAELLFGIRSCLLLSVFYTLVLYKLYELIMIIRFIAIQSKISAVQNGQVTQNGERAVG